jgi:hypothetical protein
MLYFIVSEDMIDYSIDFCPFADKFIEGPLFTKLKSSVKPRKGKRKSKKGSRRKGNASR